MASNDEIPRPELEPHRRIGALLLELCNALEPHVDGLQGVRHFVKYGENGLAFDVLVDRCITPMVELTLDTVEKAAFIGEAMGMRSAWVDLVVCLSSSSLARLPEGLRTLAQDQVDSEIATNPVRAEWLTMLRSTLRASSSS